MALDLGFKVYVFWFRGLDLGFGVFVVLVLGFRDLGFSV